MPLFNIAPEYVLTVKSRVIHPFKCPGIEIFKKGTGVGLNRYFLHSHPPPSLLFYFSFIIEIIFRIGNKLG